MRSKFYSTFNNAIYNHKNSTNENLHLCILNGNILFTSQLYTKTKLHQRYSCLFSSIKAKPEYKFVISDSGKYGMWFSKRTTNPYSTLSKLPEATYLHIISNSGSANRGMVTMHWIERGGTTNDIESIIKSTPYNDNTKFLSKYGGDFSNSMWSGVEWKEGKGEVNSISSRKIKDFDIKLVVSKQKYKVTKRSSFESTECVGKEVVRLYAHAFLYRGDDLFLEVFQPAGGSFQRCGPMEEQPIVENADMAIQDINQFIEKMIELRKINN